MGLRAKPSAAGGWGSRATSAQNVAQKLAVQSMTKLVA